MLDKIRKDMFISTQQLEDILQKFTKKNEQKKRYTWLAIILSVVAIAGIAFAVYKFFFVPLDDCDEFDELDDELDDIDFDEDFDDDYDDDDTLDDDDEDFDEEEDEEDI